MLRVMRKIACLMLIIVLFVRTQIATSIVEGNNSGSGKIIVVATIPPLASIAREVGGEYVEVYYLVPPTSDPHQFTLSPSDMDLIRKCDLFIAVGKESFLGELPADSGRVRLSWEDWVSGGITVRDDNPHYLWLYPENAVIIADKIAGRLAYLDPAHSDYYYARLREFKSKIKRLIDWINEYTMMNGVRGEKIVLGGAHFQPIAEAMGLTVIATIIRGEGKLPSSTELNNIVEKVKKEKPSIILVLVSQRTGDEGRIAEMVSRETGVPVAYAYAIMFNGNDTYIEFIKYTVTSITSSIIVGREGNYNSTQSININILMASYIILLLLLGVETIILVRR